MRQGVFVSLFLFVLCGLMPAATIYVPDDFATVQEAINAAATDDTIVVRAGTYVENVDFTGKGIVVRSESGPEVTILDGGQAGSVVTFGSGEGAGSVLEGFTVANGTGTDVAGRFAGGGIFCGPAASPTVIGNIVRDNDCWDGGGIHVFDQSSPLISGNLITNNVCKNGGAINITLDSAPVIIGNELTANTAPVYGGGIRCDRNCDALIENNVITDNLAVSGRGGGIYCFVAAAVIRGNWISGNEAKKCGGGIYCKSCSPVIESNTITRNRSTDEYGGGIQVSVNSRPMISGNNIYSNSAFLGGGGINCYYSSEPTISNNNIVHNSSDNVGGGINCSHLSNPTIVNCTVVGNSAASRGGGIAILDHTTGTVVNLIVWGNNSPSGPEIFKDSSSGLSVTFSAVKGGWNGVGNIDTTPLFVDAAHGDYHLTYASPCLNAGYNLPGGDSFDIEGDPRIAIGTVDMGADEFYPHLYSVGGVSPGANAEIRAVGKPSLSVTLFLGAGVQSPPQSTPHGDLHILWPALWQAGIGTLSADGVLSYSLQVPPGWVSGEEKPLQALIGQWGNAPTQFSNLLMLVVD